MRRQSTMRAALGRLWRSERGFALPTVLGTVKQTSGSFGPGFLALAAMALSAAVALRLLVFARDGWPASDACDLPSVT